MQTQKKKIDIQHCPQALGSNLIINLGIHEKDWCKLKLMEHLFMES
jgi:hypothetical protein